MTADAKTQLWEWIKTHARDERDAKLAAQLVKAVLADGLRDAGLRALRAAHGSSTKPSGPPVSP